MSIAIAILHIPRWCGECAFLTQGGMNLDANFCVLCKLESMPSDAELSGNERPERCPLVIVGDDTGDKTTTSADYKKILDKQLQLLIEEQGKGFLIDIHDRIVNLAKNLLVLNPADSSDEFGEPEYKVSRVGSKPLTPNITNPEAKRDPNEELIKNLFDELWSINVLTTRALHHKKAPLVPGGSQVPVDHPACIKDIT